MLITCYLQLFQRLNRHFKATRGFDIINDSEFTDANKVFGAKCVDLKRQGLAKVEHKPPICEEDLKKLYESTAFELTKNRREDDEGFEGDLMYEKPGPNCPVVSFELYLSHLNPLNEFLFQRPKRNVSTCEDVWYDNMVVGERTLGEKMKTMSREAKLSKCYTNHSIRATAVTILDKSGFEARHIMAVSGHKNEASIRSYSKTDICTKRKMSETLTTTCEVSEELSVMNSHQSSPAHHHAHHHA